MAPVRAVKGGAVLKMRQIGASSPIWTIFPAPDAPSCRLGRASLHNMSSLPAFQNRSRGRRIATPFPP